MESMEKKLKEILHNITSDINDLYNEEDLKGVLSSILLYIKKNNFDKFNATSQFKPWLCCEIGITEDEYNILLKEKVIPA